MIPSTLRIATRKSPLALWQAQHVADALRRAHPALRVELVGMTTRGDKILDSPLAKMGGKGLFIKELEQGLIEGSADLAVHSMKDVPADFPPGLCLTAIMARGDPRDVLVSNRYGCLEELPTGARVGTCSLRRQCQLRHRFPWLRLVDLRGNVNTRLAKLDRGELDAIILAAAGLERLGMASRIRDYLDPRLSLPAIGQGAIGIECRDNDAPVRDCLEALSDRDTQVRVSAERALNARLQGSCQVPIAGFAVLESDNVFLRGLVGDPADGSIVRGEIRGPACDALRLGEELAEDLLRQGADAILRRVLGAAP